MATIVFTINLAGAVMLLLFGVHVVRSGIERLAGSSFQRLAHRNRKNLVLAAGIGTLLAIALQSSTAAALLTAAFMHAGYIGLASGVAMVLGADFGSALVVQVLSFQLDWLIPVLLVIGGWCYLGDNSPRRRHAGWVIVGIALILISLRLIGEAAEPVRQASFMPALASYLEADFVTAFLAGAVIAFVMHSSVGAILLFVTFVNVGVLPVTAGISLVLGANIGGALIAVWLSRRMEAPVRRIPFCNLILRGTAAIAALPAVHLLPALSFLESGESGQALVHVHLLFNAALVVIFLPFVGVMEGSMSRALARMLPDETGYRNYSALQSGRGLEDELSDSPKTALRTLTREVLHLGHQVEIILSPAMDIYQGLDAEQVDGLRRLDREIGDALVDIRRFAASLQRSCSKKEDIRRARELADLSFNFRSTSDIVVNRMLELAEHKDRLKVEFSNKGWDELVDIHARVLANLSLTLDILLSDDVECARQLVIEKASLNARERKSRKRHQKRLRDGEEVSFESSDIHLDTLSALKDMNSRISAFAYSVLDRNGMLLESRLIDQLEDGQPA